MLCISSCSTERDDFRRVMCWYMLRVKMEKSALVKIGSNGRKKVASGQLVFSGLLWHDCSSLWADQLAGCVPVAVSLVPIYANAGVAASNLLSCCLPVKRGGGSAADFYMFFRANSSCIKTGQINGVKVFHPNSHFTKTCRSSVQFNCVWHMVDLLTKMHAQTMER